MSDGKEEFSLLDSCGLLYLGLGGIAAVVVLAPVAATVVTAIASGAIAIGGAVAASLVANKVSITIGLVYAVLKGLDQGKKPEDIAIEAGVDAVIVEFISEVAKSLLPGS